MDSRRNELVAQFDVPDIDVTAIEARMRRLLDRRRRLRIFSVVTTVGVVGLAGLATYVNGDDSSGTRLATSASTDLGVTATTAGATAQWSELSLALPAESELVGATEGALLVTTDDSLIRASLTDGTIDVRARPPGAVIANSSAIDPLVAIVSPEGHELSLLSFDGSIDTTTFSIEFPQRATFIGEVLYYVDGGSLVRYDASTPSASHQFPMPEQFASVDLHALVGLESGDILAVAADPTAIMLDGRPAIALWVFNSSTAEWRSIGVPPALLGALATPLPTPIGFSLVADLPADDLSAGGFESWVFDYVLADDSWRPPVEVGDGSHGICRTVVAGGEHAAVLNACGVVSLWEAGAWSRSDMTIAVEAAAVVGDRIVVDDGGSFLLARSGPITVNQALDD